MKILFPALLACCAGLGLTAPDTRADAGAAIQSVKFADKKVMVTRESGVAKATNTVELPLSIKVMTNGTFTVKDGKKRPLRDGEVLDKDGMLTSPDGTVAPVTDHVVMKKGRVMLVKDGDASPATGEVVLGDGRRIRPDGTIRTPEGRIERMLDGQLFTFEGKTLASTDTATLIKGAVVLQKDGGRITLRPDQKMAMADGTQVFGNGTVIAPDGKHTRLVEGVILKLPGVQTSNR